MLTEMEAAMLKARGFTFIGFEPKGKQVVAKAMKGRDRAEALGTTRFDAARKLVAVVVRP